MTKDASSSNGIHSNEIHGHNVVSGIQINIFKGEKLPETVLPLRHSYLNRILCNAGVLPLEGIDPKISCEAADQLSLGAVYTALLTLGTEHGEPTESRFREREPRRISALELLNRHPHMVLLGDPGSGKSTFVNFLAICHAGEGLGKGNINLKLLTRPLPDEEGEDQKEPQPWNHGFLLPVRVILRDFAARGLAEREGCASDLWQFIEADLKGAELSDFAPYLAWELLNKGGLILLDGLDEVPEAENRRFRIKKAVQDFISIFPKCRVLVTSRTYAYQKQEWRISGLFEAVLAPFSKGQILRFIDRWYDHITQIRGWRAEDGKGKAELLKGAVSGSQRLRELAERPLLLTLMASLHAWSGGKLPEKREELYAKTVDLLLDRWESEKIIRDHLGNIISMEPSLAEFLKADRDRIRELLNELAYEVHGSQLELQGTADISEKDLVYGLVEVSDSKTPIDHRELIRFLRDRAGLLVPRGVKVYTFPHRTFQEYLAACHLTDLDYPDQVAELARNDPDRWREVALLAGAKAAAGASANIWALAEACCYKEPDDPECGLADTWGALFAGQALVESARLDKVTPRNLPKLERIRKWQVRILEGDRLPAFERALAGRHLAVLGDSRKSVMSLAQMEFCFVPGGGFHMGSNDSDREKPPHLNEHLQEDYWLSRHPVTNAQFVAFVEAGGYAEGKYWVEAEKEGFWKEGKFKGKYESNFRDRPNDFGSPFNFPNHPVVGVTWYEALAFTRWLTEQWRNQGIIGEDRIVCLPSEAEWEKAARGGIEIPEKPVIIEASSGSWAERGSSRPNEMAERKFPWGDEIDKEKANYSETGIGTTSAIGCFSTVESPYGCLDLAGNVWEWTRSLWGKDFMKPEFGYPYEPSPEREDATASPEIRRVLRGGAFSALPEGLRCASRLRYDPNLRSDLVGFRCCVCAPNTSVLW